MKPGKDRTKVLSLRLKPKEHSRLVAEAEALYLPLSAYVRQRLFGGQARKSGRSGREAGQKR